MFDTVRNNQKLVQVFLLVITIPFALWGVDAYVKNGGDAGAVATVGSSKITVEQFDKALNEQRDRMRANLGGQFNPAMLDAPEVRKALLENLINQRLLQLYAMESRLGVSNEQLAAFLTRIPDLQEDGKFSASRFEQLAAAQGLSKVGLEERIRQELALRAASSAVVEGGLQTKALSQQWLAAALEAREISPMVLRPEDFVGKVELGADAAKTFYEANLDKFKLPEQLRFEFVVLSQAAIAEATVIPEAEIKAWYDGHQDRYKSGEERKASHILILADKSASPDQVAAAESKAKEVLKQVRDKPADFAKLARQYSQDEMSAKQGGSLGVVSRGVMVKPFEDAVFALKDKEVSDVVRTDYGFHIIRLDNLKPGSQRPLAEVRAEIAAELKAQQAAKRYAEAAEGFMNIVYEQADSLSPAVEKYHLKLQQGPWIAKGRPVQGLSEKVISALFSDDAVKNKRNTEAVEIAPNTLMAARVVEFKPASTVPLDEVKVEIEKRLKRDEAAKLALKEAEQRLEKLKQGESVGTWDVPKLIARAEATKSGLGRDAMHAVFKLDPANMPAYTLAKQPDGSAVLFKVSKVVPMSSAQAESPQSNVLRQQYVQMMAEMDFAAWLQSLRERFKVSINSKMLEKDAGK